LYSCAAASVTILTDTERRAVPLQQLSQAYRPAVVNRFKTDYNALTKFNTIKLNDRQYLINVAKLQKSKK